jgi:hypothetical protein
MTFAAEEPEKILSQDAQGRVLVSRERRAWLLEEYAPQRDERSKVRTVRRDQILNAGLLAAEPASSSSYRPNL